MQIFTPPGLYDVSVALLRELAAMYARHGERKIPVIVYQPSLTCHHPDGRRWEDMPPCLAFERYGPQDVPQGFRRWFLDVPFAIAIPEAVWRACPHRLIDFDADGREIVLKESWDGPGIRPPKIA